MTAPLLGVLPAYAGMILNHLTEGSLQDGAPRVCGDDPTAKVTAFAGGTCSPRMRG